MARIRMNPMERWHKLVNSSWSDPCNRIEKQVLAPNWDRVRMGIPADMIAQVTTGIPNSVAAVVIDRVKDVIYWKTK